MDIVTIYYLIYSLQDNVIEEKGVGLKGFSIKNRVPPGSEKKNDNKKKGRKWERILTE